MATSGGVAVDFAPPFPAPLYPDGLPPAEQPQPVITTTTVANAEPPSPQIVVQQTPVVTPTVVAAPPPPPLRVSPHGSKGRFIALVVFAVLNVVFGVMLCIPVDLTILVGGISGAVAHCSIIGLAVSYHSSEHKTRSGARNSIVALSVVGIILCIVSIAILFATYMVFFLVSIFEALVIIGTFPLIYGLYVGP